MITVHGEPSFHLATPELELDVTARAGQLAPVVFHLPGRDVSPYSLAPWQPAEFPDIPPLLAVLRGDFFCLPFAGREGGPPHGAPANDLWSLVEAGERSLHLRIEASDTGAVIDKILSTRPGHHAVYADHRVANLEGDFNYGTHPILDFSHLPEGGGRVTTSAFRWASTFPGVFSDPAKGERQALAEGARFTDLREVPLAAGGTTDLTRYPARRGFEDLVMMVHEAATPAQPFAWSAVRLDGYVWFALKNPVDFPATLFWISNAGRSGAPWNDRHAGRLGIEDVCSHFCNGLETSRENLLAADGIPTTRRFEVDRATSLRVVQAVAAVPEGFGAVARITPRDETSVTIADESGHEVVAPLDWRFVL